MNTSALGSSSANAPWLLRKDWACGRIRSTGMAQIVMLWVMAALWNGFVWTWIILIWSDPDQKDVVKVLSLFGLVGMAILVWAIRRTWAWLRFGASVFELASVPGVIGGTLEGQIQTGLKTFPAKPIELSLTCTRQHTVTRGSGSKTETEVTSDILWQTDRSVPVGRFSRGPTGLTIPVRFIIPSGLASSDTANVDDQILWHLVATADLPGVNFQAEFLVPVFVTEASRSEWTEEKVDEMVEQERDADSLPEPASVGIGFTPFTIRPTPQGGIEYLFRMALPRRTSLAVTLSAVLVCAGSAGLYLWLGELGPFAVLPGILGLLLLLAAIVICTYRSRVRFEGNLITVRKSVAGIPLIRRIPFDQVSRIRVRREEVEGLKEKDRNWEIQIDRKEGAPVKLGVSIRDRAEAERLAAEFGQQLR